MRASPRWTRPGVSLPLRSESKAGNDNSVAWLRELVGAGERRADVSEATGQQARFIDCNRRGRIGGRGVVQISTVEEVRELHAKVEAHPLPDSPGPPQINILVGVPGITEVAVERRRCTELSRGWRFPCSRIEHRSLRCVEAMAVEAGHQI